MSASSRKSWDWKANGPETVPPHLIGSSLGVLALAVALVLGSLRESIVFFNLPTDIAKGKSVSGTRVRLGGMVKPGSLQRGDNLLGPLRGPMVTAMYRATTGASFLTCSAKGRASSPRGTSSRAVVPG